MTFTERLMECRKTSHCSQTAIAKACNISLRAYQYYESGEREPTTKVLLALADYFDVSLDYLCGRSDNPTRL